MQFDEYQKLSERTMPKDASDFSLLNNGALGLAGECGEVLEHVKKYMFHGQPLDEGKLAKELGDVLFYIAMITTALNLSLGDVAHGNVKKLQERWPDGFDPLKPQAAGDNHEGC